MGVMSSGLGLGYDRGQYTSGHGPPHGMLRQKSIGEAVCFFRLPLSPPVRLSSGPVEVCAVLTCLSVAKNVLSVALNSVHFICRKKDICLSYTISNSAGSAEVVLVTYIFLSL